MSEQKWEALYNVSRDQAGDPAQIDPFYLSSLSYEALPALEGMDQETTLADWGDTTIAERVEVRRAQAAKAFTRWETWDLSAWLSARG